MTIKGSSRKWHPVVLSNGRKKKVKKRRSRNRGIRLMLKKKKGGEPKGELVHVAVFTIRKVNFGGKGRGTSLGGERNGAARSGSGEPKSFIPGRRGEHHDWGLGRAKICCRQKLTPSKKIKGDGTTGPVQQNEVDYRHSHRGGRREERLHAPGRPRGALNTVRSTVYWQGKREEQILSGV